jgi:PilZ domain
MVIFNALRARREWIKCPHRAADTSGTDQTLNHYAIPPAGVPVHVTFPQPYGGGDWPVPYRVSGVSARQMTLWPVALVPEPKAPSGTPCLIGSTFGGRESLCEGVVVTSGPSTLVVDVARDPRRHPRYKRACKVRLEVPGRGLGVIEAELEDISTGGMRVRTPVPLPLDARVFVAVLLADTEPILAIAEVRGAHAGRAPNDRIARLQFTVMSPSHHARLATLLEWPVDGDVGAGGMKARQRSVSHPAS